MNDRASLDGDYRPSPIPRIRDQVALYESTDGAQGGTLEGTPVVILTSVGARSGLVRKNPVIRIVDGDSYVAVASAAGAATNPSWYGNLLANPRVRVQDGRELSERVAREVQGAEKERYWSIAERFWPRFPEYRERAAGRDIPILLLERPAEAVDQSAS